MGRGNRREFERQMERRRGEELEVEFKPVERGSCIGSAAYRTKATMTLAWIAERLRMESWTHFLFNRHFHLISIQR
jgi:hypothetical protein